MASIIKASIDLNKIPKDKIFIGKKGKYLPITITINDELDQFGNQGPVVVEQTKEERDAKESAGQRKAQVGWAKRVEKIRTYNFPQDRVTDHRIEKSWHGLEKILEGELNPIVEALVDYQKSQPT